MTDPSRIAENLAAVRNRIAAAAVRSGRSPGDVRLVAVTKYVGLDEIAALLDAGCQDFGESRPQSLWQRAEAFSGPNVRWHLIGHLQRNKVARTVAAAHLIHSVDSDRLLRAIDAEAAAQAQVSNILLEVNISGDSTKHGVKPGEVDSLIAATIECAHVRVLGLMTMASLEGDLNEARMEFDRLRVLRDRLVAEGLPANVTLAELSMGMSGDFEQAIEAGATIVRVGSALYEGLE
jgi:pyridoxal phosphate enzyme (YggS family)